MFNISSLCHPSMVYWPMHQLLYAFVFNMRSNHLKLILVGLGLAVAICMFLLDHMVSQSKCLMDRSMSSISCRDAFVVI